MESKSVSDSKTEQVHLLMPRHINGYKRLFGGKLMEWIDIVAAVTARRHSNMEVTTIFVDNLHFKEPAFVNSTIVLIGKITYVGKTSMEVKVETFLEDLAGGRKMINRAYLVMVAINESGEPQEVPRLTFETKEEEQEFLLGKKRHELRKKRKIENY